MPEAAKNDDAALDKLKLGASLVGRQLKYSLVAGVMLGLLVFVFDCLFDYLWFSETYQRHNHSAMEGDVAVMSFALAQGDLRLADLIGQSMLAERAVSDVQVFAAGGKIFYETHRPGMSPPGFLTKRLFGGVRVLDLTLYAPDGMDVDGTHASTGTGVGAGAGAYRPSPDETAPTPMSGPEAGDHAAAGLAPGSSSSSSSSSGTDGRMRDTMARQSPMPGTIGLSAADEPGRAGLADGEDGEWLSGAHRVEIGHLLITLNPEPYLNAFMGRSYRTLGAKMFFTISLAVLFTVLSYFVVARPLMRLANYIVTVDPADIEKPMQMPPAYSRDDEIQLLSSVTVGLFGMIRSHVGDLRRTRDELRETNTHLEKRVEQRTEELKTAMDRLTVLATTDPLTGLPNRREFMDRFENALAVWKRRDVPVALILLDIDRFKGLNDTFGHQAGDAVLISLAALLKRCLRDIDLPARLGGEEFAILLAGETREGAMIVAERIRAAIEDDRVTHDGLDMNYTASFGVLALPFDPGQYRDRAHAEQRLLDMKVQDHSELADMLYSLTDKALYRAKSGGRNQCMEALPDGEILSL